MAEQHPPKPSEPTAISITEGGKGSAPISELAPRRDAAAMLLLSYLESLPVRGVPKEAIDRELREERDSWADR